ncbi:MAG: argJ [Firmicutes bacterium]|nr:argJ [Bacillota bacterium]
MMKNITGGVCAPQGFTAAGVKAGIKKSGKEDVTIIFSEVPAAAAAMFTTNAMAAAPVLVSRQAVENGWLRAAVVNSGCANASTGEQGLADAKTMATVAAEALGVEFNDVLVASTGIIGVNLPMDKVTAGIKKASTALSKDGHSKAIKGIMTTDTFTKECAFEFDLDGTKARIAGIAKGAGMIHPNMATMLCFITTDAAISPAVLKAALQECVDVSFHMITVDGDTSTNDMISVMASGQATNKVIDSTKTSVYKEFVAALKEVCIYLAKQVVQDGEGATKFLEIQVKGAASFQDAKKAAMSVAKSPLVKTAFFGQDPNWGRILCAVGYSGAEVDQNKTTLALGGITIVKDGVDAKPDIHALQEVMKERDINVEIQLGQGTAQATVWTCDFSYEYVKINADYST